MRILSWHKKFNMWRTLGQLFAGYYCTTLCLLNLVFLKSIAKPWTTLIFRTKEVQKRILQGNVYSTNYLVFSVPPLDLWLLRQIQADLKRSWFIHYIWRSCLIMVQCSSLFFQTSTSIRAVEVYPYFQAVLRGMDIDP